MRVGYLYRVRLTVQTKRPRGGTVVTARKESVQIGVWLPADDPTLAPDAAREWVSEKMKGADLNTIEFHEASFVDRFEGINIRPFLAHLGDLRRESAPGQG